MQSLWFSVRLNGPARQNPTMPALGFSKCLFYIIKEPFVPNISIFSLTSVSMVLLCLGLTLELYVITWRQQVALDSVHMCLLY